MSRLHLSAKAEESYTKTLKIIDFEATTEILDAVNEAILAGCRPIEIVEMLKVTAEGKRTQISESLRVLELLSKDNLFD